MASTRRISLLEREVKTRLARAGLDVLFDRAAVLTESQREGAAYVGSTMLSIDLASLSGLVSDECDAALARLVTELLADDERARERARRVALAEAERRAGRLDEPAVDLHVHRDGTIVHLDLDVESRRKP
jgi:hypothetical protein